MRLDQFEWSRNPRGLHNKRVLITPVEFSRWTEPQFGWAKLVSAGTEYVDDAMTFMSYGITPVVRIYRARWGARPMDRLMRDETLAYLRAGVKWFEFYNEPNLPIEWPEGTNIHWQNMEIMIPLIENWLDWAEFIISQGGYPGFISLAESTAPDAAAIRWMDTWLNYLHSNHYERFRQILANGAYCATHPYILNHFYQEMPGGGPLSARPPEMQNAAEPGWHFDYPYDPLQQSIDPGRTVYGGTALTPYGDPVGLLAMGRMFNERCAQLFGSQAIPVLGTEGGIYPFPKWGEGIESYQQDNRYPPYTSDSQAQATLAMFEWITREAPPWFFGVCLWKEDDYFEPEMIQAVYRLRERAPLYREVPPLEVMRDGGGSYPQETFPPGPGPIHGEADLHMIVLADGLGPEWFLDIAESYWQAFRPIVSTRPELIGFVSHTHSLAATVIAPPDQVEAMTAQIQQQYPNVWFDLIVAEDRDWVANILHTRALRNQRFG